MSGSADRRRPALRVRESARSLALRVIRRVTDDGAYSNLALAAALAKSSLPARDRHLAAELVYGTLRRMLIVDRMLGGFLERPLETADPVARTALRLGTYQLAFTRIPDHAAVGETVGLVPRHLRGFVNAILRRVATLTWEPPAGDDAEAVSARTGLAVWAVEELALLLPAEEVEPAAAALAEPAPLSLRANRCRSTPEALAEALRERGHEVTPGSRHPDVLLLDAAVPRLLPGYREGWFTVQDEASVLVGEAVRARPGERILDACAGPGGKAAHLACAVAPGGRVIAADRHPRRVALVRSTLERLGLEGSLLVQDGTAPALRDGFDAVLVDAPCSGIGAARRRPELLWRPERERLSSLARLQAAILIASAGLLGPGGRLVYSVCTFPRAETDAAVRAFLAKRPEMAPAPVPGPDGEAPIHRLWPHRHGTDAMFVAGFART